MPFPKSGREGVTAATGGNRALIWLVAVNTLAIIVGLLYLKVELGKQQKTLEEIAQNSAKAAPAAPATASTQLLEQRPWVAIGQIYAQPLAIEPGAFNVVLQDSGKTPAVDVQVSGSAQLIGSPAGSPTLTPVSQAAGTLFQGSQFKTVLDFRPPPAVLASLYRGQGHLDVHVNVAYSDIFKMAHTTQACWSWQPAFRQLQPCSGYGMVN